MKNKPRHKSFFREPHRRLSHAVLSLLFRPIESKPVFEGALNSLIIIAPEKTGDAILLTPLIKRLRTAYPTLEIAILASSEIVADFFRNDPNISTIYTPKKNWASYLTTIRKKEFDLLFNPKDHLSFSAVFHSRFIRARHRVGIFHPSHKGFFNYLIDLPFLLPVIEKNCALLDYVGVTYVREECPPYLPPHEISGTIRKFIVEKCPRGALGINLSAGESDREWSIDKWRELLRRSEQPAVIFAMHDRYADKLNLEAEFPQVIPSPQTQSIYEAGEIIAHLGMLVSPDTALIHVASCVGTPVVGLYRSDKIHYTRFPPWLVPNVILISPSDEIEDIPLEAVVDGMQLLLKAETDEP